MIKNKQGAIAITGMLVLLVVAVLLTFGFLLSKTIMYSVLGIAVLGGGIYVISTIKNDRLKLVFIGALLIGGFILLFSSGVLQTITSYDSVYKQNWGNICCVQHDDYDITTPNQYMDNPPLRKCDDYTNECLFEINPDRDFSFLSGGKSFKYAICDLNGNYCTSFNTENWASPVKQTDSFIKTIPVGKSLKFENTFLQSDMKYFIVNKKVKTFYIKGQENGKIYTQESCILDSDLRGKVTSDGKNELNFDECQNYMIDFIKVATRTYNYNGQDVICQARQLYEIDERTFKDGSTNKIQGEKIKSVECCPAEANCDSDTFEFEQEVERECTYSSECYNGGDYFSDGNEIAGYFVCIDGSCVKKTNDVECTNTATCIDKYGEGSVCDLSQNNYGNCITSTKPTYCGDGECQTGETESNCPADCREILECAWYEEVVPAGTKEDCGVLGWKKTIPLVECETETFEATCKTSTGVYILAGIIIVVILGIIIIVSKPKKRKRK